MQQEWASHDKRAQDLQPLSKRDKDFYYFFSQFLLLLR